MYVMAWVFTLGGCVLLFNTIFPIDALSGSAIRPGAVAVYFTQTLVAFGVGDRPVRRRRAGGQGA